MTYVITNAYGEFSTATKNRRGDMLIFTHNLTDAKRWRSTRGVDRHLEAMLCYYDVHTVITSLDDSDSVVYYATIGEFLCR